jgi:hypothetical protein
MTIKNQIIRLHRWFGLIMCLFFVAWFLSGFVMMYAGFPQYTRKNRLAHQSQLLLDSCLSPSRLSPLLLQDTSWKGIRLDMLLNRPVFRMENHAAELYSFYADNGAAVPLVSAVDARAIAINYLSGLYSPLLFEKITKLDQWIPRSAFLIHMPVYRITMNDPAETVIYVSSKTGEILQVHTFSQRLLAWCGPVIHWIYPKELILHRPLWRVVVILFSSLGMVASLTGIIAGFIRLRKRKKSIGRAGPGATGSYYVSPYREKWFRWHHYMGFVFGLFTFTWIFSGLLSMSPFGWSPQADITDQENRQLQEGNLMIKSFIQAPGQAFAGVKDFAPVEIELRRFQGMNYYIASSVSGETQIVSADVARAKAFKYFPQSSGIRSIQSLNPGVIPVQVDLLDQEDNYYYSKHNDDPLPVLRIKYADAENTWYYLDLYTGEIRLKNTASSRMSRWLYNGLHSLDFFKLQHYRPLWDVIIILLLSGGTAVSLTGLVMALKYIGRRL